LNLKNTVFWIASDSFLGALGRSHPNELERLLLLLDDLGLESAGTMIWDKGAPVTGARGLATQHEYVLWRLVGTPAIRARKQNLLEIQDTAKELMKQHGTSTDELKRAFRQWLRTKKGLSKAEKTYDLIDDSGRVFRSDNLLLSNVNSRIVR
jgi:adenine-specific DNA-methyltransferase